MASNLVTAIDVGSDSVKAVSLRRKKGRIEVVGVGRGRLEEVDRSAPEYLESLGRVINRVLKRNSIPVGFTVAGLSGRGSMIRYLSVPMVPPWKLAMLMGFEVEEQIGASSTLEHIAYDYRILNLPGFDDAQFPMFLALSQIPVIEERMSVVSKGVRRIDDVDFQCLGSFNLLRATGQWVEDEPSVMLNIGAEEVSIAVQYGDDLCFARTISGGGRRFTQRIQKTLELLPTEAEDAKVQEAEIFLRKEEDDHEERARTLSHACRAEASALVFAVRNSLRFFKDQFHIPEITPAKVFVTGGASRLKGLDAVLQSELGCDVEALDMSRAVVAACPEAEAMLAGGEAHYFSDAVGMALARLEDGFYVSLLPPAVKEKREFWSRKVYAYYSGILATALIILLTLSSWREADYYTQRNARWEAHLNAAAKEHEALGVLQVENTQMADRVNALEVREFSGRDLLACLRHLQERTPEDIFFTRIVTAAQADDGAVVKVVDVASGRRGRRGRPRPVTESLVAEEDKSFQNSRMVELSGFVLSAPAPRRGQMPKRKTGPLTEQAAIKKLVDLADDLQSLDFFEEVKPVMQTSMPSNDEEVKKAFAMRMFGAVEADPQVMWTPVPGGVALSFVLRCKIRK